ncbi:MAG TPA: hypothetical protein DCY48_01995 [Candidatus Magasanikbacteria bacterium]|nr:MAG: hypothetical protein A3I74_00905 [Candidatus Magasanikbacteria bacterium RIFCSPLOWO2_02_FULL_47_16]OGH79995.1 MAG: hypothetical protein A3C10_02320 [Candidatus Magasanikbacteria bacterium RIFCSPHIGHO2_02_FULL_48_18]OGH83476.1 MAG: hypothetical protein A3G08_04085 [Candidatus Magasanikbacteria bacterium RIFCSPLOWO2_12_FULL_47_9b]HAZ28528.1 hypothetical protein [Candidatus Magasanikbacteria bacterium]
MKEKSKKIMLRDHILKKKRQHRQIVLIVGLLVLYGLAGGTALFFDMRRIGLVPLFIIFVLVGYILDTIQEHS